MKNFAPIVAQVFYPNHNPTQGYADAQERSLSSCPLKTVGMISE
jgi:hypothetical protein